MRHVRRRRQRSYNWFGVEYLIREKQWEAVFLGLSLTRLVLWTQRIKAANERIRRYRSLQLRRVVYRALPYIPLGSFGLDFEAEVALSPFTLLFCFLPTSRQHAWTAKESA